MRLRDGGAGQFAAGIVVVAVGAGEVELALPALEEIAALAAQDGELRLLRRRDRQAARLQREVGFEPEQPVAFRRQRRRLLMRRTAKIDPAFEVDQLVDAGRQRRIACRDALHADGCIAVTIGARLARGTSFIGPRRGAGQRPPEYS